MPRYILLLLFATIFAGLGARADETGPGRLAPGDRITVDVFGQAGLSGTFQVDGTGSIEIPLLGAVAVKQLTLEECEKRITERLADGYVNRPVVSVRFSEVQPIYVLGDVRTPGAFAFRHGGSVFSAIAQAGGYGSTDRPGAAASMTDFLLADERLRALESSRRFQLIRVARLEAQRQGQTTFAPPNFGPTTELDKEIVDAVSNERESLRAQQAVLENDLALQREQKPRLEAAYAAIEQQIDAEKKQFALVQEQLNDMVALQTKGLALRSTHVALQREQAAMESNISRYRSELARLAVVIGELDIKINDTRNAYDRGVLAALDEARRRLQEIAAVLPNVREVRDVRSQQAGGAGALDQAQPAYRILLSRTRDNKLTTVTASEEMATEPGDVIEVKPLRPQTSGAGAGLDDRQAATRRSLAASDARAKERSE